MNQECTRIQGMAAELALGILPSRERADALSHLGSCGECRSTVEQLAQVGDSLLLLGPEAEAPIGFEVGVRDRCRTPPPAGRTHRRRANALLAAALAVAAAVIGGAVTHRLDGSRGRPVAGGSGRAKVGVGQSTASTHIDFRSVSLRTPEGREVGYALLTGGRSRWVFVDLEDGGLVGPLRCRLRLENGETFTVGEFGVAPGRESWASTFGPQVRQVRAIQLLAPSGTLVAGAELT
ncbi:MAG: hypothetical protein ACYDAD_07020 [Acidimicrobiales bacterium]